MRLQRHGLHHELHGHRHARILRQIHLAGRAVQRRKRLLLRLGFLLGRQSVHHRSDAGTSSNAGAGADAATSTHAPTNAAKADAVADAGADAAL